MPKNINNETLLANNAEINNANFRRSKLINYNGCNIKILLYKGSLGLIEKSNQNL